MNKIMNLKILIALLFVLSYLGYAQADTIYFKDNRPNMEGLIKSEGNGFIEVEISGGVVKFKKEEIAWTIKSTDLFRKQLREKWERDKACPEKMIDAQGHMENLGPRQVEFTRGQQGIIVNAIINGKVNVKLILDTGASLVVLRKGLASELGINTADISSDTKIVLADGRQSGVKQIVLRSVNVEGLEIQNVNAAILVNDTQEESLGDGLLGMSFLKYFDFKIDQKENKLILEKLQQ